MSLPATRTRYKPTSKTCTPAKFLTIDRWGDGKQNHRQPNRGGGKIVLCKNLQKQGEIQRIACHPHRGVQERQQPGLPHTQCRCNRSQKHIIQTSHQHHHQPNAPLQPTNYDRLHQPPWVVTRQRKITRGVDDNGSRNTPPTPGKPTKNNVVTAKQVHGDNEKQNNKNRRGEEATQQPTQREGKYKLGGEAKVYQLRKRRSVPPGQRMIFCWRKIRTIVPRGTNLNRIRRGHTVTI